ncbi:hypothetical protein F4806DRAFT_210602 [Annulohypoxylon nitens]|nr:hypothetical protein F4806DRAFT_210602 [Annulohypoxylon nitens]
MKYLQSSHISIRLSFYSIVFQYLVACYALSMCSILGQRSAIVDNRLFFSSGTYNFDDGQMLHNTSLLYWLPLNVTIDISGPVDVSLLGSADLPSVGLRDNGGSTGGTFFHDQTSLYPFGAMSPYADAELKSNKSWIFNTAENIWSRVEVQGANDSFSTASGGAYTSDPATGRSFYVGGGFNGTIRFQSSNSISTLTLGKGMPPNDGGAMVYVRKGLSGILVSVGGREKLANSTLSPFNNIFVYDISSDNWYTQKATGDIPNPRSEFCAGVSAAPDDSSFQVTIHGGVDEYQYLTYNDVYVLTIPSFRWIKINDTGNPDLLGSDSPGRSKINCDVWNEAQLIVSGGRVFPATSINNDPEPSFDAGNGSQGSVQSASNTLPPATMTVKKTSTGITATSSEPTTTILDTDTGTRGATTRRRHTTIENESTVQADPTLQRYNNGPRLNYLNDSTRLIDVNQVEEEKDEIDGAPNTKALNLICNETYPPFKVLDTSTYTWRMNLNSNLEYTVPLSVSTVIGGNSIGGATLKAPLDGWSSESLKTIFDKTVPRGTSNPTSNHEPIRSSLSKGAIAGVIIGATLTAIILIWALVWLKKTHVLFPKRLVEVVKILVMQDTQWHKPELDASSNARHELDASEPRPRELHEEGATKYELPGSHPPLFELP